MYDKTRRLAIIQSMTEKERGNLDSITYSQVKRIARGSGRTKDEVEAMIKELMGRD